MDENVAPLLVKKLIVSHAKSEETFASLQLTLTADVHSDQIMSEILTAKEVITDADAAIKATKQQITYNRRWFTKTQG